MEDPIEEEDLFPEQEEEEFVSRIWKPELSASKFTANSKPIKRIVDGKVEMVIEHYGQTYYRASSISIARMRAYEKLTVGGVLTFKKAWDKVVLAYGYLNRSQPEPVSAGIELDKVIQGMVNIDEGESQALLIAALFWNTKDEDDRRYVYEDMKRKIADWDEAGIDSNFFFQDAAISIPGFLEACKLSILDTGKVQRA